MTEGLSIVFHPSDHIADFRHRTVVEKHPMIFGGLALKSSESRTGADLGLPGRSFGEAE